jgi:hypothetical protein
VFYFDGFIWEFIRNPFTSIGGSDSEAVSSSLEGLVRRMSFRLRASFRGLLPEAMVRRA